MKFFLGGVPISKIVDLPQSGLFLNPQKLSLFEGHGQPTLMATSAHIFLVLFFQW